MEPKQLPIMRVESEITDLVNLADKVNEIIDFINEQSNQKPVEQCKHDYSSVPSEDCIPLCKKCGKPSSEVKEPSKHEDEVEELAKFLHANTEVNYNKVKCVQLATWLIAEGYRKLK